MEGILAGFITNHPNAYYVGMHRHWHWYLVSVWECSNIVVLLKSSQIPSTDVCLSTLPAASADCHEHHGRLQTWSSHRGWIFYSFLPHMTLIESMQLRSATGTSHPSGRLCSAWGKNVVREAGSCFTGLSMSASSVGHPVPRCGSTADSKLIFSQASQMML